MKHIFTLLVVCLYFVISGCKTKVIIASSEQDAQILVDGKIMGRGQTSTIMIKKNSCVNVQIEKTGYLKENFSYCFNGMNFKPKTQYIELKSDDAFNASLSTDYSNKDFEVTVNKSMNENEAWKIISQIVTNYFDNLEMADKATGYMKTSWQSKSFLQKTIRTRIIVKQSSSTPLKYKLKIISEYSDNPKESVKNDDNFKQWDRVLRAYDGIIGEFQTRLGNK